MVKNAQPLTVLDLPPSTISESDDVISYSRQALAPRMATERVDSKHLSTPSHMTLVISTLPRSASTLAIDRTQDCDVHFTIAFGIDDSGYAVRVSTKAGWSVRHRVRTLLERAPRSKARSRSSRNVYTPPAKRVRARENRRKRMYTFEE